MDKDQFAAWLDAKHAEIKMVFMSHWPNAQQPPPAPAKPTPQPDFLHSFEKDVTEGGLYSLVGQGTDRFAIAPPGRHGASSAWLTTFPGDMQGTSIRSDMKLADARLPQRDLKKAARSGGYAGEDQYWAHSLYLPSSAYQMPPTNKGHQWHVLFQFHYVEDPTKPQLQGESQPLFTVEIVCNPGGPVVGPILRLRGNGGPVLGQGTHKHVLLGGKPPPLDTWFDFVHHVRWSWGTDGFMRSFLRVGAEPTYKMVMDFKGPTLHDNTAAYLNLNNYSGYSSGKPCSVVHDRVARGKSFESVAMAPLANQ